MAGVQKVPLLVFADDWGRHPSSCQHLIRHLRDRYPTCWVNTIGMRKPRLDLATLRRGMEKLAQWTANPVERQEAVRVLSPKMWPWFTTPHDRRLNLRLLNHSLKGLVRSLPTPPVAVTTLPIVADLIGVLPARRWVYYCVDDFSEWPGLDGDAMREMEADMLRRVDVAIAASETLQDKLARLGRPAHLLTHGVDAAYWRDPGDGPIPGLAELERPLVVFWGVVDQRMDRDFVRCLADSLPRGTIVLAGPVDEPDRTLKAIPRVAWPGPLPYHKLPRLGAEADVLIMPYADLPVTRAMQPLKLLEYLATGKPVVVRDLPATRPWADCLDRAADPQTFAALVRRRLEEGVPPEQTAARLRLQSESWEHKARQFEEWALREKGKQEGPARAESPAPVEKRAFPPLVVFADDWGRHPSSCQHLIRRLRQDFRVLWVNTVGTRQVRADGFTLRRGLEKLRNWGQGLTKVDEQMWVIDLPMLPGMGNRAMRALNGQLVTRRLRSVLTGLGMEDPVVLTTLPYVGWLVRGLRRRGLVYYCTDDYSHWPSADRETLQQADRELSQEADLILAASQALYEQHAGTGRCQYFPHGVDFAHFASVKDGVAVDPRVDRLPRPRIGFFGLIYEKLDFGLLAGVADAFRHGSLVMIGPHAWSPPEFAGRANVHFLGKQAYEDLPRFLAGLDVLLLPYVDDPMIRQSGPLKLRECLASGKPTVSIDVPEVRAYQPHVRVGPDRQAFLEEVRQALQEPQTSPLADARQGAVAGDGWDNRAAVLRNHIEEMISIPKGVPTPTRNGRQAPARVLHLRTVSGRGGGPEKTILNSPRFLEGQYDMQLAYIRPEGDPEYDMPQRARAMGVDLLDVPERAGMDPRTVWRLAQQIREFRPDILHAHDYKTNLLAVLLGRWFGTRTLTTMHGYVSRGGRLEVYYRLDHWALRHLDHVIAVSDDLYDLLPPLGIPEERRSLVPNAIDVQQFARRRGIREARQALGMDPARLVVGAMGRLAPEKGFDLLIQAFDRLLGTGLDAELVIAGEGPERPRLEALIAQLGRGDRVRLLGHQSEVRPLYEALDVFALSSRREGLPNVLLEAMALEVPVVATRVAGVPGMITDGVDGLLVEPWSAEELTAALNRLLADAGLRSRMACEARKTIESRYSFAARMECIGLIYDRLLATRSR
jgi:glycosyltransferase involved in cell wall biosynthesis